MTIPDKVITECSMEELYVYVMLRKKQGKETYLSITKEEISSMTGMPKTSVYRRLQKLIHIGVVGLKNGLTSGPKHTMCITTDNKALTSASRGELGLSVGLKSGPVKNPSMTTQAREIFEAKYKELHDNPYYWEPKDAAAMKKLIAKIKFSRENRDTPLPTDDKSLLTALGMFLDCIDDPWICEHYAVTVIASKYNEIIKNVRNKRNGTNKQSKEERIRTDLANAAETFARLDAERVANLGRGHTEEIW